MTKYCLILFATLLSIPVFAQGEAGWLTNIEEAQKQASEQDKFILMSFSGSDWCANCMRLEQDLFQQQDFQSYAAEHLVLLKVDFPAKKKNQLSNEQTKHNETLAEEFNPKGIFPTTIILNAEGEVVGEMSYPESSVNAYLNSIIDLSAAKH